MARLGERWTHKEGLSVGPLGGIQLQTTYDLRSYDKSVAGVFFTGRVESKPGSKQTPAGVESAEHNGQYDWDTRAGQLVRCVMERRVTLGAP